MNNRNRQLKHQLKTAFSAPPAKRKAEFLAAADFPREGRTVFFLRQAGFIRKRVWAVSFIITSAALLGISGLYDSASHNVIWVISSLLPFAALVGMTEIARSASFRMAELEMSCKYGFHDVALARMGILGAVNFLMLSAVAALFTETTGYSFPRSYVYLFVPYILTCVLSLAAFNRLRAAEWGYACAGISVFISAVNSLSAIKLEVLFTQSGTPLWVVSLLVLTLWTALEARQYINMKPIKISH